MESLGDCVNFNFNFNFSFMGSRYFFWLFKFRTVKRHIHYRIGLAAELTSRGQGHGKEPSDVNVAARAYLQSPDNVVHTAGQVLRSFYDTNDAVKPLDKLDSNCSNTHLREHKELETGGMLQTCGRHQAYVGYRKGLSAARVTSRNESLV
jgi:hypothetical protein